MNQCPISLMALLEFSSLPMLGWLAAAALPWLIHRWHRQQHLTTSWAAMELLLSAMQQRARRVQMQQWLLLAIRTTILVLVALAVAEPALRQWALGASTESRTHRILVLDQSFSMGCTQESSSRWQRAIKAAKQMIESHPGDVFSLVAWSDECENVLGRPSLDAAMTTGALEELQLSDGCADLQSVSRELLAAIERAESELPQLVTHQVIFYTDLCPPTWNVGAAERELLESVAKRADLMLVNLGEDSSPNLAITDLQVQPTLPLRQQETVFSARVASFGEPVSRDIEVELQVEGRTVDQQTVQLRQEGETVVQFSHQFIDEGTKSVQVRLLSNSDCLPKDDQRWLIAEVRPQLRVACFAGTPGAVDDLVRALSPDPAAGNEIAAESYSANRIGELDLSKYDAVALGGISSLSDREVASLSEYVQQGGGIAFFLGSEIDAETRERLQDFLPVALAPERPQGEFRLDAMEYRHPIVAPFRGQTQAGLLGVVVMQYALMQTSQEAGSVENVLLLDSGDPALVVGRFGLGRVAVSALPGSLAMRTTEGTPWSTFAMSPSFLPVVRELIGYLIGSEGEQRNLLVGEAGVVPWRSGGITPEVQKPDGSRELLAMPPIEKRNQLLVDDTNARGVYEVSAAELPIARLAVNLDPRESNLQPIETSQLPPVFESQDVRQVSQVAALAGDFSFTRSLLAAAIVLLLAETAVACAMGRGWR